MRCRCPLEAECVPIARTMGTPVFNTYESLLLREGLEKRPRIRGPIRRKRMPDGGVERALDQFLSTTAVGHAGHRGGARGHAGRCDAARAFAGVEALQKF